MKLNIDGFSNKSSLGARGIIWDHYENWISGFAEYVNIRTIVLTEPWGL